VAPPLAAQTGLGVVHGGVQDASRAVIRNAKVTLKNTNSGIILDSRSNPAGIFYFGALPIGPYTLQVEAEGFKQWKASLTVQADQTLVIDATMEIGSLQSAVEVTDAAPIIATQGGQVNDTKDALHIHSLPLNGRQISNMFDLTPGIVGGSSPRTNGMKVGSTEVNLDGISYIDRFGGGMARVQPGLDSIQEFRIETAGSGAQFSRPATIELVTRSGTNGLHGAGFEVLRDNAAGLRARARDDFGSAAKLIRNEYGGWMGGPVLLPGLYNGKNKTFWFFDWEGMKQRQDTQAIVATPTAAMWDGNLSNITDTSGNQYTIYDPATTNGPAGTRLPFVNNVIPLSRLSPYANVFRSVTPAPNIAGPLNPWTDPNFQTYYPNPTNQRSLTIKTDHYFSEKDSISGRFTHSPYFNALYGGKYGFPPPGCTNCGGTSEQDSAVYSEYLRWNHVFSSSFFNELQLAGLRSATHIGTLGDSTNWAKKLGLPNPFGATGWPAVYFSGYNDPDSNMLFYGGWDGDNIRHQNLTSYEIDDNVTWVKAKHTVRVGFKSRQEYNNIEELQQAQGVHSFYSDWTESYDPTAQAEKPFTGTGFADLMLGLPTFLSAQYNRGFFYFQQKEFGTYINDTWKVSPRLTVGLGLRWDHWTPYHEKYDRLVSLDPNNYPGFKVISPHNTSINNMPNVPSGVLASWAARGLSWTSADSVRGFPRALVPQEWKDFGPRVSVAYKISDRWVVRGGYGTFYWPTPLSQVLSLLRTNPPLNLRFENTITDKNGSDPNYALLHAPGAGDYIPNATIDVNGTKAIPSTSRGIFILDPYRWADDRMQQWTFNIEGALMKRTSLRLSYVGNHGSNLEQRLGWNSAESAWNYQTQTGLQAQPGPAGADLRRANPHWHGTLLSHVGYSNSNSLQAEILRRFSSGLTFQWFYVYDHVLTTTDENGFGNGLGGALAPEGSTVLGNPNLSLCRRLKLVYYNSNAVPPHMMKWNGIYELPFGRGKRFAQHLSRALNNVVGGWMMAFIGYWQSGFWMGVTNGEYLFGNPALDSSQRLSMNIFGHRQELFFKGDFDTTLATNVDLTKLQALVPVDRSQRVLRPLGSDFSNKLPFKLANGQTVPTTLTDNLSWNAQNFLLGPHSWNQDLSLFKYFEITEKMRLRFTSDFFNCLNHPNDLNPNPTTGLIDLSRQSNDPRIIQMSLRLEF
jgi:hypothetical protein